MDISEVEKIDYNSKGVKEVISINGILSQRIISILIEDLEEDISSLEIDEKTKSNIIYNSIELLQNMLNYSNFRFEAYNKQKINKGKFILGYDKAKKKYFIFTSNEILPKDKVVLNDRLNEVGSMDEIQLKEYYKKIRKSDKYKHEEGAGIGLISIALKTSTKIEYSFETIEDKLYYNILVLI